MSVSMCHSLLQTAGASRYAHTFLLAQTKDEQEVEGRPELTAAQKRLKYLKIGAAAVGGGALLAVTGVPSINL